LERIASSLAPSNDRKSKINQHIRCDLAPPWGGLGGKKSLGRTPCKFLHTDNQADNKYFIPISIFIKLIVLKFAEKNYFCGGKFSS